MATAQDGPHVKAARLTTPPVIDGELKPDEWKEAFHAEKFIDPAAGKPAKDQTEAWIGYTETGIYVAFRCYDSDPSKIIGREIQPGSRFEGEDTVAFLINPDGTHQWDGTSTFRVNPLNTQADRIAGGRASKREWRGDWKSGTKRTADGWTAEFMIPWTMLNYPNGAKLNMDFNFYRNQGRSQIGTQWANTTLTDLARLLAVWEGVMPPRKAWKTKIQGLAYVAPDWVSGNTGLRSGLDIRVQPTPNATALAAINPDFRNIEQQVAGIDFTRTERFLGDARPFFNEGSGYFRIGGNFSFGQMFYSNRVQAFEYGLKGFGKLDAQTSVSALTTVETGIATTTVAKVAKTFNANSDANLYITRYDTPTSENIATGGHFFTRKGNWWMDGDLANERTGSKSNSAGAVGLAHESPGWFVMGRALFVEPSFNPPLAFIPWKDRKGGFLFVERNKEFRHGFLRNYNLNMDVSNNRTYDGTLQERGMGANVNFQTRKDIGVNFTREQRQYADGLDSVMGMGVTFNASNRFKRYGFYFENGQRADQPNRFFALNGSWRPIRKLDLAIDRSAITQDGTDTLTILTMGYEFSRTRSVTSRFVQRGSDGNLYFAYRNGGLSGTELYIILGDPNTAKTEKRISVKLVIPFSTH